MASSSASPAREPMSEMNTTPLVDVLLVLLIMLIFTFPVASHSTAVDLPGPPDGHTTIDPTKNLLVLDRDGGLQWNARPVSEAELAALLAKVRAMSTEPEVQFRPDADASYERSARIVLIVKQSGVTRFGFVENERYRTFSRN